MHSPIHYNLKFYYNIVIALIPNNQYCFLFEDLFKCKHFTIIPYSILTAKKHFYLFLQQIDFQEFYRIPSKIIIYNRKT